MGAPSARVCPHSLIPSTAIYVQVSSHTDCGGSVGHYREVGGISWVYYPSHRHSIISGIIDGHFDQFEIGQHSWRDFDPGIGCIPRCDTLPTPEERYNVWVYHLQWSKLPYQWLQYSVLYSFTRICVYSYCPRICQILEYSGLRYIKCPSQCIKNIAQILKCTSGGNTFQIIGGNSQCSPLQFYCSKLQLGLWFHWCPSDEIVDVVIEQCLLRY